MPPRKNRRNVAPQRAASRSVSRAPGGPAASVSRSRSRPRSRSRSVARSNKTLGVNSVGATVRLKLPKKTNKRDRRFTAKVLNVINKEASYSNLYMKQASGSVASNVGKQGQAVPFIMYDKTDLFAIRNLVVDKDKKWVINSLHIDFQLHNAAESAAIVDIYYFKPRKQTAGIHTEPKDAYVFGLVEQGNILQAGTTGVTPFMSSRFTRTFKILSHRQILMEAGGIELMHFGSKKPMTFTDESWSQYTINEAYIPRNTGIFIFTRGQDGTRKSNYEKVTPVPSQLSYTYTVKYKYTHHNDSANTDVLVDPLIADVVDVAIMQLDRTQLVGPAIQTETT